MAENANDKPNVLVLGGKAVLKKIIESFVVLLCCINDI